MTGEKGEKPWKGGGQGHGKGTKLNEQGTSALCKKKGDKAKGKRVKEKL